MSPPKIIANIHVSASSTAANWGWGQTNVVRFLRDARICSAFVREHLLKERFALRSDGKSGWYLKDNDGLWRVKSFSTAPISFSPSGHRGAGRSFDPVDFDKNIRFIAGFLVVDSLEMPHADVYAVHSAMILEWMKTKELDEEACCSRERLLELLIGTLV